MSRAGRIAPFVAALPMLFLFAADARGAQTAGEIDEGNVERRLQFNRYIEDKFGKAQPQKNWTARASYLFGADSNPTLNSLHDWDTFHQGSAAVSLDLDHDVLIGFLGSGAWGLRGEALYKDFVVFDQFDREDLSISPYLTAELGGGFSLEANYEFESVRYVHRNRLSIYGHRAEARLVLRPAEGWTHAGFFEYVLRHYPDRRALLASADSSDDNREDSNYKTGYELTFRPFPSTEIGGRAAWQFNESNDLFLDFNDYHGVEGAAFVRHRILKPLVWTVAGGYDHKRYEDRIFQDRFDDSTDVTETDRYFTAVSAVTLELAEWAQVFFTYTYGQNGSNDPSQEYSFTTLMAGVTILL